MLISRLGQAILVPVLLTPVAGSLIWAQNKAKKENILVPSTIPNVFKEPTRAANEIVKQLDVGAGATALNLPADSACPSSDHWVAPRHCVSFDE